MNKNESQEKIFNLVFEPLFQSTIMARPECWASVMEMLLDDDHGVFTTRDDASSIMQNMLEDEKFKLQFNQYIDESRPVLAKTGTTFLNYFFTQPDLVDSSLSSPQFKLGNIFDIISKSTVAESVLFYQGPAVKNFLTPESFTNHKDFWLSSAYRIVNEREKQILKKWFQHVLQPLQSMYTVKPFFSRAFDIFQDAGAEPLREIFAEHIAEMIVNGSDATDYISLNHDADLFQCSWLFRLMNRKIGQLHAHQTSLPVGMDASRLNDKIIETSDLLELVHLIYRYGGAINQNADLQHTLHTKLLGNLSNAFPSDGDAENPLGPLTVIHYYLAVSPANTLAENVFELLWTKYHNGTQRMPLNTYMFYSHFIRAFSHDRDMMQRAEQKLFPSGACDREFPYLKSITQNPDEWDAGCLYTLLAQLNPIAKAVLTYAEKAKSLSLITEDGNRETGIGAFLHPFPISRYDIQIPKMTLQLDDLSNVETMIHELSHYVAYAFYKNDALPYERNSFHRSSNHKSDKLTKAAVNVFINAKKLESPNFQWSDLVQDESLLRRTYNVFSMVYNPHTTQYERGRTDYFDPTDLLKDFILPYQEDDMNSKNFIFERLEGFIKGTDYQPWRINVELIAYYSGFKVSPYFDQSVVDQIFEPIRDYWEQVILHDLHQATIGKDEL